MVIGTPWNKFEIALLLDAYLKAASNALSFDEATSQLSKRLRAAMKLLNVNLSGQYRNEIAISHQIQLLEYCYTDGASGIENKNKILQEICDLYKSDFEQYANLLTLARKRYPVTAVSDVLRKEYCHQENVDSEDYSESPSKSIGIVSSTNDSTMVCDAQCMYMSPELTALEKVLHEKFSHGYRLNSSIERKKLIRLFQESTGMECPFKIDEIDDAVNSLGIAYNVKVYFPDLMLDKETSEAVRDYIQTRFETGVQYIYYEAIYKAFNNALLESQIVNIDILHDYLRHQYPHFHYNHGYVAISAGVEPNVEEEVFKFIKDNYSPVSEDFVIESLYYLPKDKIHYAFTFNANVLISNSRNNERFHIDNFEISSAEIGAITLDIARKINAEEYISWKDLLNYLNSSFPQIFTNNPYLSDIGVRNALKVILSASFTFNNNVICSSNKAISVENIVRRYIRNHDMFTLDEMKKLSEDFGTGLYWDVMTKEAVRVDASSFVSKRSVRFDIKSIDKVLEEFCSDDYMSIGSITLYSAFPSCGYPWNGYLLENYVAEYSRTFKIVHNSYLQTKVAGAVVRRNSKICSIDDIVLDILIKAQKQYNATEILELLKDENYIARVRYEGIEHLVEQAMLVRQNQFE